MILNNEDGKEGFKYLVPINHHIKETEHLQTMAYWEGDKDKGDSLQKELEELYALRASGHQYYPLF